MTQPFFVRHPRIERSFAFLVELIKVAFLAAVIIALVRYFLFKPFYVRGASMEPNFYEKEYLIIDELSYRFKPPARGDTIVFRYPGNPKEFFLKRIIAMPGERIKIHGGKIIVYNEESPQGKFLEESPYLPSSTFTTSEIDITLGYDEYYVLGDNRNESFDSRRFGPIRRQAIVGRAWIRGWPFDRVSIFSAQSYSF